MSTTRDLDPLGSLGSIGLDELNAIAELQTRRERKYLVPRALVGDLLEDCEGDARVLVIDHATSFQYESVYFDTPHLESYLAAARRRPRRYKVRTRSYLDAGACALEVKTRDARGRTVKHRCAYDIEHRRELTDAGKGFIASIDAAATAVDDLVPTLTTAYRRSTVALSSSQSRVTIDVDLRWVHVEGRQVALPGLALIETKTAGRPCAVDGTLWQLGHRPVTISKYCTGLAALSTAIPANKWNRVLRRHFGGDGHQAA